MPKDKNEVWLNEWKLERAREKLKEEIELDLLTNPLREMVECTYLADMNTQKRVSGTRYQYNLVILENCTLELDFDQTTNDFGAEIEWYCRVNVYLTNPFRQATEIIDLDISFENLVRLIKILIMRVVVEANYLKDEQYFERLLRFK